MAACVFEDSFHQGYFLFYFLVVCIRLFFKTVLLFAQCILHQHWNLCPLPEGIFTRISQPSGWALCSLTAACEDFTDGAWIPSLFGKWILRMKMRFFFVCLFVFIRHQFSTYIKCVLIGTVNMILASSLLLTLVWWRFNLVHLCSSPLLHD